MTTTGENPVVAAGVVRVYLLDDHDGVRAAVRGILEMETDLTVVGDSGLATRAVTEIPAVLPDVAVLDCRLADGSGVEVARRVRALAPGVRVLLLTSYSEEQALASAVMGGAAGFVLKGSRGHVLAEAVRRVATGETLIDPVVAGSVLEPLLEGPAELEGEALALAVAMAQGRTDTELAGELGLPEDVVVARTADVLVRLGLLERWSEG